MSVSANSDSDETEPYLLVGAPMPQSVNGKQGSGYASTYSIVESVWTAAGILAPFDGAKNDRFGSALR